MKIKNSLIKPFLTEGRIKTRKNEYTGYLDLLIENDKIAEHAMPGQFVMVRGWDSNDPVFSRPFDIVQVNPAKGLFRLIIKIAGKGTAMLNSLRAGSRLLITGPLGNPVEVPHGEKIILLVRGAGAAAVVYLAESAKKAGTEVFTFLSASTRNRLVCRDYLKDASNDINIITDDGSDGYHGDARDILEGFINKSKPDRIYTCGSKRFARFTGELEKKGLTKGYVFLESYMACGMGDCHGCAVKKRGSGGYFLVCKDGPVFPVNSVELD
ncbi:MAG: dihydroorotate dehydrogenase electron transfer subunit [Spirochaetes bacterium]|nr:dihydroorotate dehydrogenase electron transfer subunit [Spirochaetota bacterium]